MSSHALTHLSLAAERTPFWVSHREFHTHTHKRERKERYGERKFFFWLFFFLPITSSHRTAVIMFSSDDLSKIIPHSLSLPASRLIALPSFNNKLNPVCQARCQATGAAAPCQKEIRTVALVCSPPSDPSHTDSTPLPSVSPPQSLLQSAAQHCRMIIPFSCGDSLHQSSGSLFRITVSPSVIQDA